MDSYTPLSVFRPVCCLFYVPMLQDTGVSSPLFRGVLCSDAARVSEVKGQPVWCQETLEDKVTDSELRAARRRSPGLFHSSPLGTVNCGSLSSPRSSGGQEARVPRPRRPGQGIISKELVASYGLERHRSPIPSLCEDREW